MSSPTPSSSNSNSSGELTVRSNKRKTQSSRAGLQFPVARIHRRLREERYADNISAGASVYLAATLEYLTAEILVSWNH